MQREGEYWLYHGDGDSGNKRRVCLAIAPREDDSREGRMTCYPTVVREGGQLRVGLTGYLLTLRLEW